MAEWVAAAMVAGSMMSSKGAVQSSAAANQLTAEQWQDQVAMWEKDFAFKERTDARNFAEGTRRYEDGFAEGVRQYDTNSALGAGQAAYAFDFNEKAIAENDRRYALYESDLRPYRESGKNWLGELNDVMSGKKPINETPAFKFRLDQGHKAVERGAAAKAGLYSGSAGVAHEEFAQGMASQEYENEVARQYKLAYAGDPFAAPQEKALMAGASANAKALSDKLTQRALGAADGIPQPKASGNETVKVPYPGPYGENLPGGGGEGDGEGDGSGATPTSGIKRITTGVGAHLPNLTARQTATLKRSLLDGTANALDIIIAKKQGIIS